MKRIIPIFVLFLLSAVFLLNLISCGKRTPKVLRIGTNAEYPPFEYKKDGELRGIDIDLLKAITERLGVTYEIIDMDFDALIPSLTANKIDVAISAITITEDRQKLVDFTIPYYTVNQVIIAKKGATIKLGKVEDIAKYKVGAQNSTTGQIYVSDNLVKKNIMPRDNLKIYSTNLEAINELLAEKINLVIIDDTAALGYSKLKAIETIFKIDTGEQYGIALPKNSTYKAKINQVLDEMIKTDRFLKIVQDNF